MSSGIPSHWSSSSQTVAQHCIYSVSIRVTINQASVNDLPVEEKSVLSAFLSFNHAIHEHQHLVERLHVGPPGFVCVPLCVRTILQSGCLFLAVRCRLINFDRLPFRPTTNMLSQETRHFHCRSVFLGWFLFRFWLLLITNPVKLKLNHYTLTSISVQLLKSGFLCFT